MHSMTACHPALVDAPVAIVGHRVRGMEAGRMRGGLAAARARPDRLAREQVRVAQRAAVQARGGALWGPCLLLRAHVHPQVGFWCRCRAVLQE